jgi:Zn-dependent M28 family amino/carboxypeptidase
VKFKLFDRAALIRLVILALIIIALLIFGWSLMVWMPGESYAGKLPPLSKTESELQTSLNRDVGMLSDKIGIRNYQGYQNLLAAKEYLAQELTTAGYSVKNLDYSIENKTYTNLEVEIPGTTLADEILVIGAHYDSPFTSPGANDNGTGAAAVLALAREFAHSKPMRTLRFVEFTNEEPPFFWTDNMGSMVYARQAKQRGDKIVGMFSLETLGYYSDTANSQQYPPPLNLLYPNRGNFLGFIGNIESRELLRNTIRSFRAQAKFPSEGAALPNALPGVGWSDHWAFWQQGYQAVMITDTATFRYPHYHTLADTVDKIDFDKLARVVSGISNIIADFGGVIRSNGVVGSVYDSSNMHSLKP